MYVITICACYYCQNTKQDIIYACAFSSTFNGTYSTAVSLVDWYGRAIQNRQGSINNMTVLEYHKRPHTIPGKPPSSF